MKSVLVTGSRDWDDPTMIRTHLETIDSLEGKCLLLSGACPTGADAMAEAVALSMGWEVELHPALWDRYGKRAGYIRNRAMVDKRPDYVVAFIKGNSRGASMTLNMAIEAGLNVTRYDRD